MVNSGSTVLHSGSDKFGEWLMIQNGYWGCCRDIDYRPSRRKGLT